LGSVRLFNDRIGEKDRMVVEKDRVIAKMDEVVAEKDRMVAEKDKRIAEKDEAIQRLEESADIATALRETRRAETSRKWGKSASTSEHFWIQTLSRVRHPFAGLETPTGHWAGRPEYVN
jgi:hypothetical protein